jgi:hypothetical protein
MDECEYLLSYGLLGDFGRFRAARPLACRRGDRAVVRSHRGLELARVLRPAAPAHARFLPNTTVGQLLRLAGPEDEAAAARMAQRGGALLARGVALAGELGLPLELLDAEALLDGEHAVLHYLRWADADVRPFVSALSRAFEVHITLQDLTRSGAGAAPEEEAEHGCGREGCGGGACGSCGTGGGCGSCGAARPEETQAYFAGLREQLERRRTPLL